MPGPDRCSVRRLMWVPSVIAALAVAAAAKAGPTPAQNSPPLSPSGVSPGPSCAAPYWEYELGCGYRGHPNRFRGQAGHGLKYYQYHYPYDQFEHHRRTYPHTYRGQFGLEPEPPKLEGRFWSGPGYSPFNRYYGPQSAAPQEPVEDKRPAVVTIDPDALRRLIVPRGAEVRPRAGIRGEEAAGVSSKRQAARRAERDESFDRAWDELCAGQAERSQYSFASIALSRPEDGLPKAGFALAVALQDDHRLAAFLMRRALKVDAISLRDVPRGEPLQKHVRELLSIYESDKEPAGLSGIETLFLSAVMHYLLGDYDAARGAAMSGIELGDRDQSVFVLLALLQAEQQNPDPLDPRPREPQPRPDLIVMRDGVS